MKNRESGPSPLARPRRTGCRLAAGFLLTIAAGISASPAPVDADATAPAQRSLSDYKYFRALSLDLQGRIPTRQELAEFEREGFDIDRWLDSHLKGEDYAERLTRIYADLLRPQINAFRYGNTRVTLARIQIKDDTGKDVWVYYRPTTRRVRLAEVPPEVQRDSKHPDYAGKYNNLMRGGFCLLESEIGLRYPDVSTGLAPVGTAKQVDKATLDKYTTVVRPWWLYADYKSASPTQRYAATEWASRFPGYVLSSNLLKEPDGKTDTLEIRVCKEEASAAVTAPADANKTLMVACQSAYGAAQSSGCGCGPGLDWCMPGGTFNAGQPTATFVSSRNVLLGVDDPSDQVGFTLFDWQGLWLSQEPLEFLRHLFAEDRDLREVVTGRYTYVNGPLSQFYKFAARSTLGDADLGQTPLPAPASLPPDLLPQDAMTWKKVDDRGPNAAGLLSMPWFNVKNATRRARGHVVYNAFLCRDFVAPAGLQLPISQEPNLMAREGCAACHQTLEPLSAYFARTIESDWNWLDAKTYPAQNTACKQTGGKIPGSCSRYDNTFSTPMFGMLRGAYAAPGNADAGPAGLGKFLTDKPEFARCAVHNIASSFLGRELRTEDAELEQKMIDALVGGGYKVRPLMKVLLNSNAYRSANNQTSTVWRNGGKP